MSGLKPKVAIQVIIDHLEEPGGDHSALVTILEDARDTLPAAGDDDLAADLAAIELLEEFIALVEEQKGESLKGGEARKLKRSAEIAIQAIEDG